MNWHFYVMYSIMWGLIHLWSGCGVSEWSPIWPPPTPYIHFFWPPAHSIQHFFNKNVVWRGACKIVHEKLVWGVHARFFMYARQGGGIQYFHVFPGGHTTFLFHKGSCNIFVFKEVHNILYVSETQMPFTVNPGPRPQHCLNSDCNFTN